MWIESTFLLNAAASPDTEENTVIAVWRRRIVIRGENAVTTVW